MSTVRVLRSPCGGGRLTTCALPTSTSADSLSPSASSSPRTLWDSVAAETGELPLSAAQTAELDHRLADLARDPGTGESWEVVRERVERHLHKAG